MRSNHILFIVNPVSGRMKSKNGLFEILDELYRSDTRGTPRDNGAQIKPDTSENGESTGPVYGQVTSVTLGGEPDPARRVTVVPTMCRGHAAELAAASVAEGYDTVICCGGDGTLNETITGLLTLPADSRPRLGYIPAGTTNDFAASLGLPSTLRGAARVAVGGIERPLDIGAFRPIGHETLPARNFSYIASFGIFTAASYSTPQSVKNVLGHSAYVLEGIKDLANVQPHHATFELASGKRLEGDYVFGAVTNTTSAAGIFKFPAGQVAMSDGLFEVLLVHNPRTLADFNRLASALLAGNFDNCPLIEFHHTTSVTVTLTEPLRWSLDGEEALAGTRVEIRCLPGAVQFKVPQ